MTDLLQKLGESWRRFWALPWRWKSPALVGADAAALSFNGTTDVAFSVGCFFLVSPGNSGTLI
ncbi:hypothetical protein LCGC14_2072990, partial [marine sediment metagenome]